MEEIMKKEIFNDKVLHKFSPDYIPTDIASRLQERRAMYRDTHNHSITKNSTWQRKTVKRIKDGYKVNKEVVKMRNGFHNIHLRNQLLLKTSNKRTTVTYDLDTYNGDLLNDIKIFNDDTDKCMLDIEQDMAKLVLCNDSDFKLNSKEKPLKECRPSNIKIKEKSIEDEKNKYEETVEHTLRIECTYACKSPNEQVCDENSLKVIEDNEDRSLMCNSTREENVNVNDLQTLLIMMAISKRDGDEEVEIHTINSKCAVSPRIQIESTVERKTLPPISVCSDVSQILNIIPLRLEMNEKQSALAKKCIQKWRELVMKRKEYLKQQREETLNMFFEKLAKKKMEANTTVDSVNKAKTVARDFNTYQHRYKIQKHIIALQKAKLEEQNRLIEELKYNRIIEASRQSVDAMKEEVRKTYYEIDRQLKPKIKCLTNELKLHEIVEPSLVLHCLKVPQFLQRMEKRAREREEKHAMIRERRRQMEEERLRLKQQAELAKAEMDKEEKIKRIKELRDKRRKEKIENIRKKQYAARLRALIVMADLHYERYLKEKYGIKPFKILLQIKRDNIEKAKMHYNFQLTKNVFLNWMWYTEDMWFERNYKAEDFYRKKLLRKVFKSLTLNLHDYILKKQVADDYYDLYLTQLVFRKFREVISIIRKENELKWQKAVVYYNSNLLFKVVTCWRTLPALNALKREQEARKARWREKVLLVVPDYAPPDD